MNDVTHTTCTTTTRTTTTTVSETIRAEPTRATTARGRVDTPSNCVFEMEEVRAPSTSWDYLSAFSVSDPEQAGVQAPTAVVFANNRQQVRLRVFLSPRNKDGEFVDVPETELLNRLEIVNYETGAPLPAGWHFDCAKNDYTLANPIQSGWTRSSPRTNDGLEVDIYLRTESKLSQKVAVAITSPSGQSFATTAPEKGVGGFDSGVTISCQEQPKLAYDSVFPGQNGISITGVKHYDNEWRATSWYIALYYGRDEVTILSWDKRTVPCIWWDDGSWGPWECFFTYVCDQPGSSSYSIRGLPEATFWDPLWTHFPSPRLHPRPGQIEVMMVGRRDVNTHFYNGDGSKAKEHRSADMSFIDEFGNEYGLSMFFAPDNWDILQTHLYEL